MLWIFVFVFLVRLLNLTRFAESPYFLPENDDMRFYSDWATRILSGELSDFRAFYGLPGYPFCLAAIFSICGVNPYVVGFIQCGLDAATACLIYSIARVVFSSAQRSLANHEGLTVGVLAAFGWAFFQPAQAFSIILMPTSWVVCAFWSCVWCLAKIRTASILHPWLALGFFTGIVAMGVATILFLAPLFIASIILTVARAQPWRQRLLSTLAAMSIFIAGLFAGISPAWLHNTFIAGDSVLLSAHSGLNFWMGNNPDATGYPKIPTGLRAGQEGLLSDSITYAEEAAGRHLKRSEVSRYWSAKADAYIRGNFAEWIRLLSLKVKNFWNAFQYDDLSIITLLREERVLTPGFRFGFMAALGIPGLVVASLRFSRVRWVSAAVLLHMLALLPVFITERYRLCAVPGLIILASFTVHDLWRRLQKRDWAGTAGWCAAVTASAWFVSLPQKDPALWALDRFNTGLKALKTGDLDLAHEKLEIARSYVPDNAEINFALGNLGLARNDRSWAERLYQHTLALNPRHVGALNNLGVLSLQAEVPTTAEDFFTAALSIEPKNAKALYLLATARLATGNQIGAEAALNQALALRPNQREFLELGERLRNARIPIPSQPATTP